MYRKILKKDRIKFEKEINAYFDDISYLKPKQTASDELTPTRYIKTRYGVDYEVRGIDAEDSLYNVMGAFRGEREDYARIKANGIDCNPFTGKWNFHLMDCSVDDAIDHIKRWFDRILPIPEHALGDF